MVTVVVVSLYNLPIYFAESLSFYPPFPSESAYRAASCSSVLVKPRLKLRISLLERQIDARACPKKSRLK